MHIMSMEWLAVSFPPGTSMSRQVISIGDSLEERTTLRIVSSQLPSLAKSIKFLPRPTPFEIVGQLSMVNKYLDAVVGEEGGLDLEISKEQAVREARGVMEPPRDEATSGKVGIQTVQQTSIPRAEV